MLAHSYLLMQVDDAFWSWRHDGTFGRKFGERFEAYMIEISKHYLSPEYNVHKEYKYKTGFKSPDVLISDDQKQLHLIAECKATYLNETVRSSPDPWYFHEDSHKKIVEAVFQIWRYCDHLHQNENARYSYNTDTTIGVVITLYPWMVFGISLYDQILDKAKRMADREGISSHSRIKISFVSADEWEDTLAVTDAYEFIEAVSQQASDEFKGYHLRGRMLEKNRDKENNTPSDRVFPYKEKLKDVMPWFDDF